MLDTVREFAAEQLGVDEGLQQRHARYFLEYAERAAERATHADRRVWLARLAAERGNLRVAFERLLEAGAAEDALRIATAFARALPWDAHAHEVRGWLERALAAVGPEPSPARHRALLRRRAGALAGALHGGRDAARRGARRRSRARRRALEAAALTALGRCAVLTAAPPRASAARRGGDRPAHRRPGLLADALLAAAGACERAASGNGPASSPTRRSRSIARPTTRTASPRRSAEQGFYDMVHGRLERAELRLGEAVALRRRLGDDRQLVEPMIDNAWLDLARGSGEPARHGFLDCLSLAGHVDDQFNVAEALAGLSAQAALDGRHVDAARLAGASAALHERIGAPPWESVTSDPGPRAGRDPGRPRRRRLRGVLRRGPAALTRPGDRPRKRRRAGPRINESFRARNSYTSLAIGVYESPRPISLTLRFRVRGWRPFVVKGAMPATGLRRGL